MSLFLEKVNRLRSEIARLARRRKVSS